MQAALRFIQPGADLVAPQHVGNRCGYLLEEVELPLWELRTSGTNSRKARGHAIEDGTKRRGKQLHAHFGIIDVLTEFTKPGGAVISQLLEVHMSQLASKLFNLLDTLNKGAAEGLGQIFQGAILVHSINLIGEARPPQFDRIH